MQYFRQGFTETASIDASMTLIVTLSSQLCTSRHSGVAELPYGITCLLEEYDPPLVVVFDDFERPLVAYTKAWHRQCSLGTYILKQKNKLWLESDVVNLWWVARNKPLNERRKICPPGR